MYQRKNFAYGKVAIAPSPAASGATLVLETGQGARFPNTSGGTYVCVVKQTNLPATPDIAEVVLVTSHDPANDNFTITREQEGSSARTIVIGDEFYLSPTDGVWDQIDKLTTKGDLLGFDTAYARVPVGTNDQVLTADSTADLGVAWKSVGAVSNVRNEVPSGTVNGSNTSFTIASTPVTGTLRVYVNGVRQKVTDDYTLSGTTITFVYAPLTDSKLLVDYETNAGTYATGSADFVNNETPSGLVNGSNTSFTLANTPVSGTLHLLRDGQEIYETNDWTISGATITMVAAPVTGSVLRANYQKTVSTAGNADLLDGKHGAEYMTLTGAETGTNKTFTSPLFQGNIDGWILANETWTRESDNTFSEPIDATLKYQKGDKIRYKQGAGYKYQYIISVGAYSGGKTIMTTTGGSDYVFTNGTAITDNYYSHESSPIGFPDFFNTTASFTVATFDNGSGGQPTTNVLRFKIFGNCLTGFCSFTGTKAGTDMFIKMASSGLPAPVVIGNANVGSGNFDNGSFYVPVVFLFRSSGEFWFTNGVNINDNLTVANLSSVFSYQI